VAERRRGAANGLYDHAPAVGDRAATQPSRHHLSEPPEKAVPALGRMKVPGARIRAEGPIMETATTEPSSPPPTKPARPATPVHSGHEGPSAEAAPRAIIQIRNLQLRYGDKVALQDIDLEVPERRVTAFIGPSGCGKSTLLRCLNRMNDLVDDVEIRGQI